MTRSDPRYSVSIRVDCTTRDMFVSNYLTNISRGGVFLASHERLPLDAEVDLVLTLPDTGVTIAVRGRVVWTYDIRRGTARLVPGAGIRFIDMSATDRARIDAYLERLALAAGSQPEAGAGA